MTQKEPACLLVVVEECGSAVERRETSLSLSVYSATFIVVPAAPYAVLSAGERSARTETMHPLAVCSLIHGN